ncbi:MAG TPA: hypothetical protein VMT52_16425 [Planctomycetota bacterium]|nr:hypothetical protein [Planctomycetota bacterium]
MEFHEKIAEKFALALTWYARHRVVALSTANASGLILLFAILAAGFGWGTAARPTAEAQGRGQNPMPATAFSAPRLQRTPPPARPSREEMLRAPAPPAMGERDYDVEVRRPRLERPDAPFEDREVELRLLEPAEEAIPIRGEDGPMGESSPEIEE